jgi:hypothetical protein
MFQTETRVVSESPLMVTRYIKADVFCVNIFYYFSNAEEKNLHLHKLRFELIISCPTRK